MWRISKCNTLPHPESSSITPPTASQDPHFAGKQTPALNWRYNPLMTDFFFSAFTQPLGVKSEKLSSIFSTLCTVYVQTLLTDKKTVYTGSRSCLHILLTSRPAIQRPTHTLPSMKWVTYDFFKLMHTLNAKHLLKSQTKGIKEQQNNILSPIKHICTLNYAYCLTPFGILLWETYFMSLPKSLVTRSVITVSNKGWHGGYF